MREKKNISSMKKDLALKVRNTSDGQLKADEMKSFPHDYKKEKKGLNHIYELYSRKSR